MCVRRDFLFSFFFPPLYSSAPFQQFSLPTDGWECRALRYVERVKSFSISSTAFEDEKRREKGGGGLAMFARLQVNLARDSTFAIHRLGKWRGSRFSSFLWNCIPLRYFLPQQTSNFVTNYTCNAYVGNVWECSICHLLSHPQFISCKWPTQGACFYLFLPPGVSGHSNFWGLNYKPSLSGCQ